MRGREVEQAAVAATNQRRAALQSNRVAAIRRSALAMENRVASHGNAR